MEQDSFIPLDTAKAEIIEALRSFDADLGDRAEDILTDERRLNIHEEKVPDKKMMQYRPAGVTPEEVESGPLYWPDFAREFAPNWTIQHNLEDYGIIDFEYHGTLESIAWLSHELGHAIADDIQRENGHSFRDYSQSEMERQAHFVQHIVSSHLQDKYPGITPQDLGEGLSEWSEARQSDYHCARQAFSRAASCEEPAQREVAVIQGLDQKMQPFR